MKPVRPASDPIGPCVMCTFNHHNQALFRNMHMVSTEHVYTVCTTINCLHLATQSIHPVCTVIFTVQIPVHVRFPVLNHKLKKEELGQVLLVALEGAAGQAR